MSDQTAYLALLDRALDEHRADTYVDRDAAGEAEEYQRFVKTCGSCGENWHPESSATERQWVDFHSRCAPAPCDLCGQETNTPDACFECYHSPFGVGWQREMEERGAGW